MNRLIINRLPVGWSSISKSDREMLICSTGKSRLLSKISLEDFFGDVKGLQEQIALEIREIDVLDSEHGDFIQNNVRWFVDYCVTKSENEKYVAFFYALLDKCYVLIEMHTSGEVARTRFFPEAKRLICSIDLSAIEHENKLQLGEHTLSVSTPEGFSFSQLSTENQLVFFGDEAYLIVGVRVVGSLAGWVRAVVASNRLGLSGGSVKVSGEGNERGVEWASYRFYSEDARECLGKGTYFRTCAGGEQISSFLFERGQNEIGVQELLKVRGD